MKSKKLRNQADEALFKLQQYLSCAGRILGDLDDNNAESCEEVAHFLEGLSNAANEAADLVGAIHTAALAAAQQHVGEHP